MSESTIFAKRMKETREQSGLKQKELAERVGVTPQTISAYEKGGKTPTLDNAAAIARELGVSLDWLCGIGDGSSSKGVFETLGDIASFLHRLTSLSCATACEDCQVADGLFHSEMHGPGIIFYNLLSGVEDEIGAFLSDDIKMTELLQRKTFDEGFYDRWLADRIRSLNNITVEEYLKKKYPF